MFNTKTLFVINNGNLLFQTTYESYGNGSVSYVRGCPEDGHCEERFSSKVSWSDPENTGRAIIVRCCDTNNCNNWLKGEISQKEHLFYSRDDGQRRVSVWSASKTLVQHSPVVEHYFHVISIEARNWDKCVLVYRTHQNYIERFFFWDFLFKCNFHNLSNIFSLIIFLLRKN